MDKTIFTIGHSNRSFFEFAELLKANGVVEIIDIRTIPGSRHNPQFNKESLSEELSKLDIDYEHIKGLGGLRPSLKDSPNTGWKNDSFRGYADHMQTAEFEVSLEELIDKSRAKSTAIMCAEALPWRCHRRLISDALLIRGFEVVHILGKDRRQVHTLTPFAKVIESKIIYPSE